MTYSCTDFVESIIEALGIDVPLASADSPSDQADLALAEIKRLKEAAITKVIVAVYEHKHGQDIRTFANQKAVQAWKVEIASENWEEKLDTDAPDDAPTRADAYFEQAGLHGNPEFFYTYDQPVEG